MMQPLPTAHMKTNYGSIIIELDDQHAPKTVANFLQYVKDGFYNGTLLHRVIDNFMVQGGGYTTGLNQKPARAAIANEANNGLRNVRGSIAMARTSDPHSASSQFFINVGDNDFLNYSAATPEDWGYCVFGRITDGMSVVDQIKGVPTGNSLGFKDVPLSEIVIENISSINMS